jgi:hypothetical protein
MDTTISSNFKSPIISRPGVKLERDQALIDVRDKVNELGDLVEFRLHNEETIKRDEFGNIIKRYNSISDNFELYAFPIIMNPTEKQAENAGLREITHVIIWTSVLDWWEKGYTDERLQFIDSIRMTVIVHGAKYEIKDKNFESDFSDTHLYLTLGLNRI